MPYNPNTHRRRSVRMQGYDYSQAGLYYVTICTLGRVCLFGEITNGKMLLNDLGNIANEYLKNVPERYHQTRLHEYVIMPNHIHAIIEIVEPGDSESVLVGAIHADSPIPEAQFPVGAIDESTSPESAIPVGAIHESPLQGWREHETPPLHGMCEHETPPLHGMREHETPPLQGMREHETPPLHGMCEHESPPLLKNPPLSLRDQRRKMLLSKIMGWYKMNTAKNINIIRERTGWPFWQRGYHDHIIRDEIAYHNISDYIVNNPTNWKDDEFYTN